MPAQKTAEKKTAKKTEKKAVKQEAAPADGNKQEERK